MPCYHDGFSHVSIKVNERKRERENLCTVMHNDTQGYYDVSEWRGK